MEKCKKKVQIIRRKYTNTLGLTGWKEHWEKDKPVSSNCMMLYMKESYSETGVFGYIELEVCVYAKPKIEEQLCTGAVFSMT